MEGGTQLYNTAKEYVSGTIDDVKAAVHAKKINNPTPEIKDMMGSDPASDALAEARAAVEAAEERCCEDEEACCCEEEEACCCAEETEECCCEEEKEGTCCEEKKEEPCC